MARLNPHIYTKSGLEGLRVAKTNSANQPENIKLLNTWLTELSSVVLTTTKKTDDLGEDMGKVSDCFNDLQKQLDTIQKRLEEINRKI